MKTPNKFKTGFVRGVRADEAAAEEQLALKKKAGVSEDADIFVVEKSNMAKFTINTIKGIIRVSATVALLILAAIGLICLIYPATRDVLHTIATDLLTQIKTLLGV